jgi:hypothetical protein
MKKKEIKVGGFYVKKDQSQIREILREKNDRVEWISYDFQDGSFWIGPYMCSKDYLISWAEREATPEEISRVNVEMAHRKLKDLIDDFERTLKPILLESISNEDLLAEVRRRMLDI